MDLLITIFCILLIVMAVFLVIAVLMQSGKGKSLSGAIAGSGETFYGKTKGKTADRILSKATIVVSILFVLIVLGIYIIQAYQANNASPEASDNEVNVEETVTAEEEANAEETNTVENAAETEESAEQTATAE